MFHYRCKNECRNKRYGQGIGHRLIVFVEGVFKNIQSKVLVQILEEYLAHVVAFTDDNGILGTQLVEVGKSRTKHRVGGYVTESTLLIPFLQTGLNRSYVADDTIFWQCRKHLVECIQCIFYRGSIDDQLGLEFADLIQCGIPVAVVHKAQLLRVDIEYSRFVLETQYIGKEGAHLTGS